MTKLSHEILEKFFANEKIQDMHTGFQEVVLKTFESVLIDIKEERPYATVSDFFSKSTTDDEL